MMIFRVCLVLVLDTGDELRCGKECVFNNILTGSAEAAFPFHNLMGLPIVSFRISYETMARHSCGDKVIMNGIFMNIGLIMGWGNCLSTMDGTGVGVGSFCTNSLTKCSRNTAYNL
jgi:hypothetical protein